MEMNRLIYGERRAKVIECIRAKLQTIEDENLSLLENLGIDFKKTTGLAWNDSAVWFYNDPNNPVDKLPNEVKSKVDLVISSCLKDCI
ncbi:hypothetical protein [Flavobacterium tructae]|uniref:Uncharacterized protein n=1 Tax=Flavobacterium tructae TaxID=1114873 RepID=A0A1S1J405_9FLAO|nr:hypothetical protein [Flavobacterium tructae]OHT44209.1 hypothetical protein BHE19_14905 [Flavobacterium tructae]OXB20121.1 hypothetical protein B0A71_08680 [Flavobacterium tructae]